MKKDPLGEKSYQFALRIIKLCQFLQREYHEYALSKQVLRSGTAIGAMVREAVFGQSIRDFNSKMSIALKEANETRYWICLLKDSNYIDKLQFESMECDCNELIALLVSSVKTSKR